MIKRLLKAAKIEGNFELYKEAEGLDGEKLMFYKDETGRFLEVEKDEFGVTMKYFPDRFDWTIQVTEIGKRIEVLNK